MKKKYFKVILILCFCLVFINKKILVASTNTIIYTVVKIINPIVINVENPEEIIITPNDNNIIYSNITGKKIKINLAIPLNVSLGQSQNDWVVKKYLSRTTLSILGGGNFQLDMQAPGTVGKKILGKAYFGNDPTSTTLASHTIIKDMDYKFLSSSGGYSAVEELDVIFTQDSSNSPIEKGIYKGKVRVKAIYGG